MRPSAPRVVAVALATLALACAGARAPAPGAPIAPGPRRTFPVPDDGALELAIPSGWQTRVDEGDASTPPTIELAPADRAFVVLLSPLAKPRPTAPGRSGADAAQLFTELARRKAAETSVEKELPLMELSGEHGVHGYWFAATDRALEGKQLGNDEYRHLMQGAASIGGVLMAFTLLDNGPGPQRAAVLDLVRTARQVGATGGEPGGEAGAAPGGQERRGEGGTGSGGAQGEGGASTPALEPDPGVSTVPLVVTDPHRKVSVLVDLPGFRMFKPRVAPGGNAVAVLGQDPATGVVVSVIVRQAEGADAAACRDRDLGRIRAAFPEVKEVRTFEVGGVARLTYAMPAAGGAPAPQEHAHAFLAQDGVCANVHLSKADPAPDDAARLERILATVRFGDAM